MYQWINGWMYGSLTRTLQGAALFSIVAVMLAMVSGCTDKGVSDDPQDGLAIKARFTTTQFAPDVNRMILTVTAPDMDTIIVDSWDEGGDTTSTDTIYFDGQRIYVRVDVPAGRSRQFVLEALEYGEANEPIVLYRAVTIVNVFPGQLSIVDLPLEPVMPMVRLSPRRVETGAGDNFIVDVQIRNIPGAAGVGLILSPQDIDFTRPLQARKHPSRASTVAATGIYVNDDTEYYVVALDTTDRVIVDASGNATVASVEFSAGAVVSADVDSFFAAIYPTQVVVVDTLGNEIGPPIYLDQAEVHIAALTDMAVQFADPDLESAVQQALDLSGPVMLSQMLGLNFFEAREGGITSWEGLQYALNLRYADLAYNDAPDLTPLSSLKRLRYLDLEWNGISDITPLASLKGLETLNLRYNDISNISPLSGLTELIDLQLGHNEIRNVTALSNLWKLERLQLWDQQIANLGPLAGLPSLRVLEMSSDSALFSIAALANLQNLDVLYLTDCLNVQTILPLVNNPDITGSSDTLYLNGIPVLDTSQTERVYLGQLQQRGVIVFYGGSGKAGGSPFEAAADRPTKSRTMSPSARRE